MIESLLDGAYSLALLMIMAALALTVFRLAIGPTIADRVVALDVIALLLVCFCGAFAGLSGQAAYLDIAVALALIAFLGTVAFARYVERRAQQDSGHAGPPGGALGGPAPAPRKEKAP